MYMVNIKLTKSVNFFLGFLVYENFVFRIKGALLKKLWVKVL